MISGSSNFAHFQTRLSSYKGSPFALGNWDLHNGGNKVEIMNLNDNIWAEIAEYPFAPMLYEYSSVSLEESVGKFSKWFHILPDVVSVILGGYVNGGDGGIQSTIAQYKDEQWIRLGDLKEARYGHSSIYDGIR